MLIEIPLLNIVHVVQGSGISIRGVPEPKSKASTIQLSMSIKVG